MHAEQQIQFRIACFDFRGRSNDTGTGVHALHLVMSLVQQTNSFESNLLLAWQLLQPLRLYSQLLQSQHLAHLTPSVQPATIQSLKCTTRILHNIEGYIDTEFLCRTSVAFKSASAVSSRLWQSGTIILDSAKTFSCRGEVQVSTTLWVLRSEQQTISTMTFHNLSYMKRRKPLQWLHVVPDKCNASEKWEIGLLLGQNSNTMINKLLLSLQPQVLRSDAHVFSSEYNFRWQYIKKLPPLNGRNEKTQSTANGENHLN